MVSRGRRPIQQPVPENLPPYLGFGTLDVASVGFERETLRARYQYPHGGTAYLVEWRPGRCVLQALFENKLVMLSSDGDLQAAFFRSFLGASVPAEDRRFVDLSRQVIGSGNVYFSFPQAARAGTNMSLYYPAGMLFSIRLVIVRENRPAWDEFRPMLVSNEELPLKLIAEGWGAIISATPDGRVHVEAIQFVDFLTALYQVVDACRLCSAHGVIARGQTYRMVVMEGSGLARGVVQVFPGHVEGGPQLFGVLAADPTSERSWDEQLAIATEQVAGVARSENKPVLACSVVTEKRAVTDDSAQAATFVELVYGSFGGNLVFMRRIDAKQRYAAIHDDPEPKTWGEVRRLGAPYPADLYERIIEILSPKFDSVGFRLAYIKVHEDATEHEVAAAFRALPVWQRFPLDDDPVEPGELDFDLGTRNPFTGGLWFTWPAQEMLAWVPPQIQAEFGHRDYSISSGECLCLPATDELAIVRAFEMAGCRVERDDNLVAGAQNTDPELVYGKLGGDLVFMRRIDAEQRYAAIYDDPEPKTWGEVRRLGAPYPEDLYERMIEMLSPGFDPVGFRLEYLKDHEDATEHEVAAAFRALPVGERFPLDDDPVVWEEFEFGEGCATPFTGGLWFTWPAQEMLAWVPPPIQAEFGHRDYSISSGECLCLPATDELAIVRAFEMAGYRVERDDNLVAGAQNVDPY